jgi:hypothetical protein
MKSSTLSELQAYFDGAIATVAEALSEANSHVVALVAKWSKADLVPGLSDLDLRVICDDHVTPEDWVVIDRVCGETHLKMVRENPRWNRVNEHTAGAGMSIGEAMDIRFHNPEYAVWSHWWGEQEWFERFKDEVASREFAVTDEHYHLSKFLDYFSPYIHGIDPPINLGPFEPKYALHSRCWHYFAPPILSAASLLARRNFTGKREGLTWLRDHGYATEQVDAVFEQINAHYETPEQTDAVKLEEFEQLLYRGFQKLYPVLLESARYLDVDPRDEPDVVKQRLRKMAIDPFVVLMDCARFARIRAGRYYFYANAPDHFDASRLIRSELFWVQKLSTPVFASLAELLGDKTLGQEGCLRRLGLNMNQSDRRAFQHVADLVNRSRDDADVPRLFEQAIELFPHYYTQIERALGRVVARVPKPHLKALRGAEAIADVE